MRFLLPTKKFSIFRQEGNMKFMSRVEAMTIDCDWAQRTAALLNVKLESAAGGDSPVGVEGPDAQRTTPTEKCSTWNREPSPRHPGYESGLSV